ncbi:MAG TPA: hypothetical protein DHW42_08175 [Candidatus Marinimicrobia bacterium]|nr:hypothetical protein [Candidatus Neomarinimicrobiota bacterium]
MDKYYYFAAQLPMLEFDKDPLIRIETFLTEARKWMSASDFYLLNRVDFKNTEKTGSEPQPLKEFKQFEFQLRTELVLWRTALKQRQEYKTVLFPVTIIKEGNPLEVEKKLLLLRWNFIDELEFGHYSDITYFILYYLKLQILARLQRFNKEIGKENFQTYTEIGL